MTLQVAIIALSFLAAALWLSADNYWLAAVCAVVGLARAYPVPQQTQDQDLRSRPRASGMLTHAEPGGSERASRLR
jgi:hypothetical protein